MTFVDDDRVRRLVALAAEPEVVAGRFELGMPLGEGGMGVVFEAWDRDARRVVALKLLRPVVEEGDGELSSGVGEATAARFEREAEALARLSHPGIVGYVAHGRTAQGERYLVMERLVGLTLAARLADGALSVQDAARVGQGVAAALAAAHGQGLSHRDIKPSNIWLRDGAASRATLLDFGLARSKGAPAVTRTGALVGTPSYMAPEQVRGTAMPDARGDLFALGAVLFECLTGRAPFVGADTEAVLTKILVEQPPALRQLCPGAPAAFEALIARLLAKDPEARPAGAAEVARELEALLGEVHASVLGVDSGDGRSALSDGDSASMEVARPGSIIAGKYRVTSTLGSGGMGIVLLARHDALDRHVAIKLLRGGNAPGAAGVGRLIREARAVSRLESEHVARVMDVDVLEGGAPFIVMEFLSGHDLAQVLRREKRLPVALAVDYVLQAGKALAEAHALGIVHRDLKPSNLFLTTRRDGSPLIKVLDFGISKVAPPADAARGELSPGEASMTAPDAILGSPLYMSPEQLQSAKHVDARTDIWSLGVVLQELVTGSPPFSADGYLAIAAKIAGGAPAALRSGCPEAPAGLAAVVRRCLQKDPAQRFSDMAELARALAPYASAGPVPPARRRGALVAALVAAVATGAALLIARGSGGTDAPAIAESGTALPAAGADTSSSAAAPLPALPSSHAVAPGPERSGPPDAGATEGAAPASSALPPAPSPAPSARTPRATRSEARTRSGTAAPDGARAAERPRGPAERPRPPERPRAAKSSRPPESSRSAARPGAGAKPAPHDTLDPMNPALISR